MNSRREFLSFLASSPFALAQPDAIKDPKDALDVLDFEEAARRTVPISHWAYMATGVDDDATLHANREGYKKLELRPRRLVDVSHIDMGVELFGTKWESPVFICPCGSQKAFHPDGELGTARAARAKNTLQILSTVTSYPVEEVAKALGRPPWYQLYAPVKWEATEAVVHRAEAAGCPVLVFTIDQNGGRNTETQKRMTRLDTRTCTTCHSTAPGSHHGKPMLEPTGVFATNSPSMTWDYVGRVKKLSKMKLILKGIETREDAALCLEHGVDGIVVSNHGGRAEESGRATIECLPEVVDAVGGRIPVLIDGGVRRGTDVFKALALGARAVGIGRPYLWGLGAFGQPGVERVLDILHAELKLVMGQCGAPTVRDIKRSHVV